MVDATEGNWDGEITSKNKTFENIDIFDTWNSQILDFL